MNVIDDGSGLVFRVQLSLAWPRASGGLREDA